MKRLNYRLFFFFFGSLPAIGMISLSGWTWPPSTSGYIYTSSESFNLFFLLLLGGGRSFSVPRCGSGGHHVGDYWPKGSERMKKECRKWCKIFPKFAFCTTHMLFWLMSQYCLLLPPLNVQHKKPGYLSCLAHAVLWCLEENLAKWLNCLVSLSAVFMHGQTHKRFSEI